VLAELPRLL